jgi:hypothetical protein
VVLNNNVEALSTREAWLLAEGLAAGQRIAERSTPSRLIIST